MATAPRDSNFVPTLLGVSNADGTTPVVVYADPTTHRLLVDSASGSGTVTSVSVVTANGFAGTVATATTTPAITLTTTITGVLKGNGTAISAATAGSDYAVGSIGLAGGQTIAGSTLTLENLTLRANAADLTTGQVNITSSKEATNTTTAAMAVAGGLAVAKRLYALDMTVTNTITGSITGNAGTASAVAVGGITGLGTGVATALAVNVGSAGAFVTFDGALGTPSSGTVTNLTGTASININGTVGGTTPTTATFTTATINTNLVPDANDGAGLGLAGTAFSDLFLAEGGVINWDSSDATITQTGNVLAVAGADLRVATADVGTNADSVPTLSSTSTFTNKTLTSPTLTTPSAFTTGGSITLAEQSTIILDPVLSADEKWTGITIAGTLGATIGIGDIVYLAAADSRWELADASAVTTAGNVPVAICLVAGNDGDPTTLLLYGNVRSAAFPAFTVAVPLYISETAGDITATAPVTTDSVMRRVGFALSAEDLLFNPSPDYVTHT